MFAQNFDRFMLHGEHNFSFAYRCYSMSMLPDERENLENGGKIIMPASALQMLSRLNVSYPMQFKLENKKRERSTHCGVLEFIAEEGKVYIPYWMMRNLLLDEGSLVQVTNVSLPVATFTKFQPQSVDFLDIHDPKAVLEQALRNFACLTTGDVIAINYNDKNYELCVLETLPGPAVNIVECDMNVDFETPIGFEEHQQQQKKMKELAEQNAERKRIEEEVALYLNENAKKLPFSGKGQRLDGKPQKEKTDDEEESRKPLEYTRGVPDYSWRMGTLKFNRIFLPDTL